MATSLLAYLESAPTLDEMRALLSPLGLVYRHSLPPDGDWNYPLHVFGRDDLRVVYHAGNPARGEAMVDTSTRRFSNEAALRLITTKLVRCFGGTVYEAVEVGVAVRR